MSSLGPAEEKEFARVFLEMDRHFTGPELHAALRKRGWSDERIEAAFSGMRPDLSRYVTKN